MCTFEIEQKARMGKMPSIGDNSNMSYMIHLSCIINSQNAENTFVHRILLGRASAFVCHMHFDVKTNLLQVKSISFILNSCNHFHHTELSINTIDSRMIHMPI